jgi:hypothetical protein
VQEIEVPFNSFGTQPANFLMLGRVTNSVKTAPYARDAFSLSTVAGPLVATHLLKVTEFSSAFKVQTENSNEYIPANLESQSSRVRWPDRG